MLPAINISAKLGFGFIVGAIISLAMKTILLAFEL